MTTVGNVAAAVAEFAPPQLAEEWDNVGLLLGDPEAPARRAAVVLDVTAAVLDLAEAARLDAVVAFHPLIFRPLARLRPDDPGSALVWRAARLGIAVIATHTALDATRPGTSDFLAEALGVEVEGVLRAASGSGDLKLVTFVPPEAVAAVSAALAEAGCGRIGAYAECSFRSRGQGTFRPLEGAAPTVGEVGRLTEVEEVRLEMVVPAGAVATAVRALRASHPYDEAAFDLYPLANRGAEVGMGRVGRLPAPTPLAEFAARVREVTRARHQRTVGDLARCVERVALLGGSGAAYLDDAARAGADVYVTGDLKHHDALRAERLGLAVVDPGHWATEQFAVRATAEFLSRRLPDLDLVPCEADGEPFSGG